MWTTLLQLDVEVSCVDDLAQFELRLADWVRGVRQRVAHFVFAEVVSDYFGKVFLDYALRSDSEEVVFFDG